jgi:hypothetical protein
VTIGAPVTVEAIEIVEPLYSCDGPSIVLAALDGALHYGHSVERTDTHEVFVYVPVDARMAEAIRNDDVDLRDVLLGSDRAIVAAFDQADAWTSRLTTGADLPGYWLPDPMIRLTAEGSKRAGWVPSANPAS